MSNHPDDTARMKNRFMPLLSGPAENLIARFGRARLVALPDGVLELRGGAAEDRTAAKEWISLFLHDAVARFGDEGAGVAGN